MSECQEPGNASEALETNGGSDQRCSDRSENKTNQEALSNLVWGENPPNCLTLNPVCGLSPQVFTLFKCLARVLLVLLCPPPPAAAAILMAFSNSCICFGGLNLSGYHKSDQGPLKPTRGPSTLSVLPTGVGSAPTPPCL